jgi:hypothetical protein
MESEINQIKSNQIKSVTIMEHSNVREHCQHSLNQSGYSVMTLSSHRIDHLCMNVGVFGGIFFLHFQICLACVHNLFSYSGTLSQEVRNIQDI